MPVRTCVEAIEVAILAAGRPLRAAEIAEQINREGLYRRRDGSPLPAYQVSSQAHGSPGRFVISDGRIDLASAEASSECAEGSDHPVAILIGCVASKFGSARAARDLYRSELFRRRRLHAEASQLPWFIVSAEHGLLDPGQIIEPYERRLVELDARSRRQLSEQIAAELEQRVGPLVGREVEVHAGDEYRQMLKAGLSRRGAALTNPLSGLRIGQQLAWYRNVDQLEGTVRGKSVGMQTGRPGMARLVTELFTAGQLDLSLRPDAPPAGWQGMPEMIAMNRLGERADSVQFRLLTTFTAAMDRARDADCLWLSAARLFLTESWVFDPAEVASRSFSDLAGTLKRGGLTQRHGPDTAAWRTIAESLGSSACPAIISSAIFEGRGDAAKLLSAVEAEFEEGLPMFPFLRGPKIAAMWVRLLAYPGGAKISNLAVVPVAVDVQVRKASEYLGMVTSGGLDLDEARPLIQAAWTEDVARHGAVGPGALAGTCSALDPALWFYGKWGCTRCERARRRMPIASTCTNCTAALRPDGPHDATA